MSAVAAEIHADVALTSTSGGCARAPSSGRRSGRRARRPGLRARCASRFSTVHARRARAVRTRPRAPYRRAQHDGARAGERPLALERAHGAEPVGVRGDQQRSVRARHRVHGTDAPGGLRRPRRPGDEDRALWGIETASWRMPRARTPAIASPSAVGAGRRRHVDGVEPERLVRRVVHGGRARVPAGCSTIPHRLVAALTGTASSPPGRRKPIGADGVPTMPRGSGGGVEAKLVRAWRS